MQRSEMAKRVVEKRVDQILADYKSRGVTWTTYIEADVTLSAECDVDNAFAMFDVAGFEVVTKTFRNKILADAELARRLIKASYQRGLEDGRAGK